MSYINAYAAQNGKVELAPQHNPLSRFKSYSYYHVLVMCDSDNSADDLVKDSGIVGVWLHDVVEGKNGRMSHAAIKAKQTDKGVEIDLGKYTPMSTKQGKYCVLIHGATDADVVINKLSLMTLTSAGASNNDRNTSLAVEGSMDLVEPKGVTFLNTMVLCANALGRDPANVVYLLKTFFVGYNDKDQIETLTDVEPIRFIITDATGAFTESGGEYHIEFVAMNNGAARLPQFDKVNISFPLKGATLSGVVSTVQTAIDNAYKKMYDCVFKQVELSEKNLGYDNKELSSALTKVKYIIELDEFYKNSSYRFNPSHTKGGDTAKCDAPGQTSTGTDFSIESALHHMMQHCARVEKDAKDGTDTPVKIRDRELPIGTKIQYKIVPQVRIEPAGSAVSHTITYTVRPFPIPRDLISLAASSEASRISIEDEIEPQTIHFDYIYTGKNVDILELDMKLNLGLAYLQLASVTNTFKNPGDTTPNKAQVVDTEVVEQHKNRASVPGMPTKVNIPVFFSTNLELPNRRNTPSPTATVDNTWNMTKQASIEMIDVSMKVTGNLLLLNSTLSSTAESTTNKTTQDVANIDWGYMPSFAKVHIKMPSSNDDIALFNTADQSFTTDFWFDGYYYIMGVEHVFDEGDFVQNLQLLSMPKSPEVDKGKRADSQARANFSADVLECFNGKGCGSATDAGKSQNKPRDNKETLDKSPSVKDAQAVATPSSPAQIPAKPIDSVVSTMSPDNVKGWNRMSPDVRSAITQETQGSKIPLSTYVAIAAIESNGNPGAVSSTGAAGIFQFTKSTWNSVMPNNKVTDGADPRRDPYLNARASRLYLEGVSKTLGGTTEPTWLYMGHNLGPGAARAVMKESGSGNCKSMRDVYAERGFRPFRDIPAGPGQWDKFAKSNGYNVDSTTCTLRDQIANKYLVRLKDSNGATQTPDSNASAAGTQAAQTPKQTPTTKQETPASSRTAGQNVNNASRQCKDGDNPDKKTDDKQPSNCAADDSPKSSKSSNAVPVRVGAATVMMTPEEAKKQRGY